MKALQRKLSHNLQIVLFLTWWTLLTDAWQAAMTERVKFGTLTVERSFLLSKAIRMWSTPCPSTTQLRTSRLTIPLTVHLCPHRPETKTLPFSYTLCRWNLSVSSHCWPYNQRMHALSNMFLTHFFNT